MFSSAAIISGYKSLATTYPCIQIDSVLGEDGTLALYPGCSTYYDGSDLDQRVVVSPDFESENPLEIAAALGISFGTAGWLALWIHAIIVEVYVRVPAIIRTTVVHGCVKAYYLFSKLRLTPAETARLRQVSYERQLARGFKRPGYTGTGPERFGDAGPYQPKQSQVHDMEEDRQKHVHIGVSSLGESDEAASRSRV